MDTPELPLNYMVEGRRYLEAIEKLGLRPTAFFWAFERALEAFTLVLAAEEYDHVGPLQLSRLLFKAYNAAATPRAIDPLLIQMHSPDQTFMRQLGNLMPIGSSFALIGEDGQPMSMTAGRAIQVIGGMEIDAGWVYRFDQQVADRKTVEVLRRWHRFERNVERAAA